MRTLQIGNDWPEERVGGLNRYFVDLLRYLPETGTEVRGLVVGPDNLAEKTGGAVVSFSRRTDNLLKRAYRVRAAVRDELRTGRIDLLASHFALYAAPVGRQLKQVPFVTHFHGPWAAESNVEGSATRELWLKQMLERFVYRRAKRLIVLSSAFQKELVSRYGVDEHLTRVVPGGIDIERFNCSLSRQEARERLQWALDRPIILAVRRLVRRMGLENLIDALGVALKHSPDALLLIGGTGPLAAELQQRVNERGLEQNVRLLGRIEEADLPLAYRAADLSVVPTQALEGFGMITLESLASGTPVLVTPVGGLPEVIRPFAPGCVFPDLTTATMAAVLGDVLRGTHRLPSEEECRTYAVQHFAWPLIARKVQAVYSEALNEAR